MHISMAVVMLRGHVAGVGLALPPVTALALTGRAAKVPVLAALLKKICVCVRAYVLLTLTWISHRQLSSVRWHNAFEFLLGLRVVHGAGMELGGLNWRLLILLERAES